MKKLIKKLPIPMQREVNWRLKQLYTFSELKRHSKTYKDYSKASIEFKKNWIFNQVRGITIFAQRNNPFYKKYYKQCNFDALSLKKFEDLHEIPITTKNLLREAKGDWLQTPKGVIYSNTGGSSGSPLLFTVDKTSYVREKYYMEKIWKRIGCLPKHNRLRFKGYNTKGNLIQYSSNADGYFIDIFQSLRSKAKELTSFFKSHNIEFFHGYPSAIYQFALMCSEKQNIDLKQSIRQKLKGILFGSEYPAPIYRNLIEEVFSVPTISWYGHSEMAILAPEETESFLYKPFQSYGYTEAVNFGHDKTHLIGTSYDNLNSPFIRYDTEDLINPVEFVNGLLYSFKIHDGRIGEFIIDKLENRVSLTGLIFGRHHKIFNLAEFVQISQSRSGYATIYVTVQQPISSSQISNLFDLDQIDINFSFETLFAPIRTKQGKVPLLISKYISSPNTHKDEK